MAANFNGFKSLKSNRNQLVVLQQVAYLPVAGGAAVERQVIVAHKRVLRILAVKVLAEMSTGKGREVTIKKSFLKFFNDCYNR